MIVRINITIYKGKRFGSCTSLKLIWLGLYFQGCVGGWLTGLSGNQTNLSLLLVMGSYPRLILPLKFLRSTIFNLSEDGMTQTIPSHVGEKS